MKKLKKKKKTAKKKTPRECLVVEAIMSKRYDVMLANGTNSYLFVPAGARGDLVKVESPTASGVEDLTVRWYVGMCGDQVHRNVKVARVRFNHIRFIGTKKPIEDIELPPLRGRDVGENDIPF
jgi:hypothetical protein